MSKTFQKLVKEVKYQKITLQKKVCWGAICLLFDMAVLPQIEKITLGNQYAVLPMNVENAMDIAYDE